MALMKLGIVATDIRNSVGGTVFSRNLGGAYTRARVAPVNRNTPAQTLVRSNFGNTSKLWSSTLTADQRAAWTLFAQNNPMVNVLGASIIVSGIAMFNRLNVVLAQIGSPPILDAPPDLSVPALAAPLDLMANYSTPQIKIDTDVQTVVADAAYYIFATGPLAPGKTPPTSGYRFMTSQPPAGTETDIDITSWWEAKFGTIPTGASIGARVSFVNTMTGALTPGQIFWALST
jgi:hypothetical protein